ncbi:multiple sugar transport system permease protein [Pullulanibacillus pueri]|uniref:Sugar ABC transporter permease n=1 Tax=Pullulanibacillus pueri TaxID=1437324 RepID=A0A8J3ENU5_9BACL|nr:carbohydrate ABC transporter permease [Pullulanibacillus pueri]MBM7683017.1 multiple sugar transport system permease protein [Pullulanibacillus pueri]GGH89105.1 sugar ABC transporter permease [Pullulanibacillus pueri]
MKTNFPETHAQQHVVLKTRKKNRVKISHIILHVVLILGAFIMVFPFLWTLSSSLKDVSQIFVVPPKWIPSPFVWSNFPDSLTSMPFGLAYWNSFYITAVVVIVSLFTSSLAAYAFAKIRFRGSSILFMLFLATMMIPKQVTLIPLYIIMGKIGWLDSHLSLIVPGALFNAFAVFLLRQFIKGIPRDLEEAAIIDGASTPRIYFSIILPLIKPALSAVGIFIFLGSWNNFIEPLIFLNTPEKFTVPLLLNQFKGLHTVDYGLLMAGTTISVIPVLIIYIFAQRKIIEGVTITGIKG